MTNNFLKNILICFEYFNFCINYLIKQVDIIRFFPIMFICLTKKTDLIRFF